MRGEFQAVAIDGDAAVQCLEASFPLPLWFRFVTGFAPRSFLRLDPVSREAAASP